MLMNQPHFVRCTVPTTRKKTGRVDVPPMPDQPRCNGVLEGIRTARLEYPNRLPSSASGTRCPRRASYRRVTWTGAGRACAFSTRSSIFHTGMSKIFEAGVHAGLEERRDALLFDMFSRLQAVARMFTARRQMRKILDCAVAVRTIQRDASGYGEELRDWPSTPRYTGAISSTDPRSFDKIRPFLATTWNAWSFAGRRRSPFLPRSTRSATNANGKDSWASRCV